ncbi:hypothetical protein [Mangrovicoccus algicola]|uniref:Uncharacterized protein n=1 Tax=Mangrovicoccus algicola TaxID=2771008 RepID=A0A8J6YTP7_9RHOB|nr:hypothetical protein [Mangrovicoccus algicola]MBE3639063.1 hypothetical protein [Mangrovicoccus algicola]
MSDPLCLRLAGAVLPDPSDLRRRHVRKPARRTDHYLERYDRRTLFYDCVYHEDRGEYLFTAPRFLNLWQEFRDRLRLDGAPVRGLSRQWSAKYEQVRIRAPRGTVSLDWPGGWQIAPRADLADRFAGLDAVVTMNRDNDLRWIREWLAYLCRVHGLEAAVIFDNGSTAYRPQDLAETIAAIPGMRASAVLVADYPYGPRDSGKGLEVRPKFLQPALMNLARTDLLRKAGAVLNADIDEIVLKRGGQTVFEATRASRLGALRLPGSWAYPGPEDPAPCAHRFHVWRATGERPSNPKWCAVPGKGLSRAGWFVHHVGGELFRLLPARDDLAFVHCRGTSTGWKGGRFKAPGQMARDPELEALMQTHFSGARA